MGMAAEQLTHLLRLKLRPSSPTISPYARTPDCTARFRTPASTSHQGLKQLRIRYSIPHEAAQRYLRVEKHQPALEHRAGVGGVFYQPAAECAAVLQGGYHEDSIAPFQALAEKPADVLGEQPIVGSVELYHVLFGFDSIEKLRAG